MEFPPLRKLNALEEIRIPALSGNVLPILLRRGLAPQDAVAVAGNAALLCLALDKKTPGDILGNYSLEEIATLCEAQREVQAGNTEYGVASQKGDLR